MVKKLEYLFYDFPDLKITEEIRKDILKNLQKYSNCNVRIRLGKFYTDEEKEKYIQESLQRKLPSEKILLKKIKIRK